MILMIDNYDSFTFNLVQYLKMLGEEVKVVKNNEITLNDIRELKPECIFISPGPCTPLQSGISIEIIKNLYKQIPIMGICLGHQTIGYVAGASIIKAIRPVHGKVDSIEHDGKGVFKNILSPISVTRYHSLVIDKKTLPNEYEISSITKDGEIMGIRHKEYPIEGVQFHPEAILTQMGLEMLNNFLIKAKEWNQNVK